MLLVAWWLDVFLNHSASDGNLIKQAESCSEEVVVNMLIDLSTRRDLSSTAPIARVSAKKSRGSLSVTRLSPLRLIGRTPLLGRFVVFHERCDN